MQKADTALRSVFSKSFLVTIVIIVLNVGFSARIFSEEKESTSEKSKDSQANYFQSVNRLQHYQSINGQSSFSQGSFIILPYGLSVAELAEFYTAIDKSSYENFNFGVKLAKYIAPSTDWGKAFSSAVRFQAATGVRETWSAGLQWNISETPGIKELTKTTPWKALFQVFAKDKSDSIGTMDMYLWHQVPILGDNKLYLRGMYEYYFIPGKKNYYNLLHDLIFPLSRRFEIFARYTHQNVEFLNRENGPKYGFGLRFAY